MFAVHCPGHGARILLGPRSIVGFEYDRPGEGTGVVVRWRCHCGAEGRKRMDGDDRAGLRAGTRARPTTAA